MSAYYMDSDVVFMGATVQSGYERQYDQCSYHYTVTAWIHVCCDGGSAYEDEIEIEHAVVWSTMDGADVVRTAKYGAEIARKAATDALKARYNGRLGCHLPQY